MPLFQNIPQPGDILSQSQSDLSNNFQYLDTVLGKDHQIGQFPTPANSTTTFEGRHLQASFSNRAAATAAGAFADGAAAVLFANNNELQYFNAALSPVPIQLTSSTIGTNAGSNGYTFLPGGIMVQWGTVTGNGTNIKDVLFASVAGNQNFPTALWFAAAVSKQGNSVVYVTSTNLYSITGFRITLGSGTSSDLTYLCIGN